MTVRIGGKGHLERREPGANPGDETSRALRARAKRLVRSAPAAAAAAASGARIARERDASSKGSAERERNMAPTPAEPGPAVEGGPRLVVTLLPAAREPADAHSLCRRQQGAWEVGCRSWHLQASLQAGRDERSGREGGGRAQRDSYAGQADWKLVKKQECRKPSGRGRARSRAAQGETARPATTIRACAAPPASFG